MSMRLFVGAACALAVVAAFAPAAGAEQAYGPAAVRAVLPVADGVPVAAEPLQRNPSSALCCPVPEGCPCPESCLDSPILCVPCVDACYDKWMAGKEESCLKLGAFAYHWFHYGIESEDITYGYPGGEGTYFYGFTADLECDAGSCTKFGGHVQLRVRDGSVFRSFFDERVWLYEAYASMTTPSMGTLKAGKIWSRFGMDWDGSFWGNVAYYNGFKLDPDWGFSWEHEIKWSRLTVPFFVQAFFGEDEVNGSIEGGDAESTDAFDETFTGIVRAVPTWHIDTNTNIALGLSALIGSIDSEDDSEDSRFAWAVDAAYTWCGLKVFGEFIHAEGRTHEAHYVTGGPSDEKEIVQLGAQYKMGPYTFRATWSQGTYSGPGGDESIFLVGIDAQLTKWLLLTLEYQNWDVNPDGADSISFEEGISLVFNWSL